MGVVLSFLSLLVYVFFDLSSLSRSSLPWIWAFFAWNFYAYGFDRGMWPRVFVELDGHGKGSRFAREVVFWVCALLYAAFLATLASAS